MSIFVPRLSNGGRKLSVVVCLALLRSVAQAEEIDAAPDFDLRVEAPDALVGEPLEPVEFEASVVLQSRGTGGDDALPGAEGWSLSLKPSPGAVVHNATTQGTAADLPPAGYFLKDDGFQITQLTTGPSNDGVISAVALSFFKPVTLPRNGYASLLRLTVETQCPDVGEGCRKVTLEFSDGLKGTGLPIINAITYKGQMRRDDGSLKRDNDRDKEESGLTWVCTRTPFSRGDCSPYPPFALDISDPITALNFLFMGGERPPCIAACDANDDENLDITDPIFTLNHLFLGGPPMPEPYRKCGFDPTPGPLSCVQPSC